MPAPSSKSIALLIFANSCSIRFRSSGLESSCSRSTSCCFCSKSFAGVVVIRSTSTLQSPTASQSRAGGDGHNCVPNKDRANFPQVWEFDHTVAGIFSAGARALAPSRGRQSCYFSFPNGGPILACGKAKAPPGGTGLSNREAKSWGTACFMSRSTDVGEGSLDNWRFRSAS
jgi:hypothetical protein